MAQNIQTYLKAHTEALVKELGVEASCAATGRSKATIGRYYSRHGEHEDRFIPIDAVARLEAEAGYPHVTAALAELAGLTIARGRTSDPDPNGHVAGDVAVVSQRFAQLMNAYASAMADNRITPAEARRMLSETMELQRVLVDMKLRLEAEVAPG
ncbi:MAG: phage regulatory CII family protein [Jannaschia sp.]